MDLKLLCWLSRVSMRILDSRFKCFCFCIMDSLPLGGRAIFIKRIIKEDLEKINSTIELMDFCKIKFHRGVEFNFASEICEKDKSNILKTT